MSILIKGMEMPKNKSICIEIFADGGVHKFAECYPCAFAVEVLPHGRLIDADALYELIDGGYDLDFDEVPETKRELLRMITDAPTIIEAEVNDG